MLTDLLYLLFKSNCFLSYFYIKSGKNREKWKLHKKSADSDSKDNDRNIIIFIRQLYFDPQPELDFVKNKIDSASDYLNKFEHWAKKRNPHVENAQHWDNAVLLTRWAHINYPSVTFLLLFFLFRVDNAVTKWLACVTRNPRVVWLAALESWDSLPYGQVTHHIESITQWPSG